VVSDVSSAAQTASAPLPAALPGVHPPMGAKPSAEPFPDVVARVSHAVLGQANKAMSVLDQLCSLLGTLPRNS